MYTLWGEGNCYLVVLMLVVTIFIKLLCFGYFSSSPWSSMTPQATRPPAFPVFLLPSSASPVPLQVTSLRFGISYAGQLSLCISYSQIYSNLKSMKSLNLHSKVVRTSVDHDGTTSNVPKQWKSTNLDLRNTYTTVLFQDWSRPTSLPHHRGWEFCQRGQCWFPQKEASQCYQGPQHGSPWHRTRESPQRKKYHIQLHYARDKTELTLHIWHYSQRDLMHHWHRMKLLLSVMFNRGKEWSRICSMNSTSGSVLHLNISNESQVFVWSLSDHKTEKKETWFPLDQGWSAPQQPGSFHWCCPRHEHGTHEGLSQVQPPFRGSLCVLPRLQ